MEEHIGGGGQGTSGKQEKSRRLLTDVCAQGQYGMIVRVLLGRLSKDPCVRGVVGAARVWLFAHFLVSGTR